MTQYQTKSITQPMEFIGEDSLSHHGILGMKWGVRRYQNPDGSLTEAGKKRYSESSSTYQDRADKARQQSKKALKVMAAGYVASVPASLITAGMAASAAALTPAVIGGLAVTTLLAGTGDVARYVAIGKAAVSAWNQEAASITRKAGK